MNRETVYSLSIAAGQLSDDLLQWVLNEEEGRVDQARLYLERATKNANGIAAALKDEGEAAWQRKRRERK